MAGSKKGLHRISNRAGIGWACGWLFLIIAGPHRFSIADFQALCMPLCVQKNQCTTIHTLERVCIPANSTIVFLAFGLQIAPIQISMQTYACSRTFLSRHTIRVRDNILHLFLDLYLYPFVVTNMVQYFIWMYVALNADIPFFLWKRGPQSYMIIWKNCNLSVVCVCVYVCMCENKSLYVLMQSSVVAHS
jgi:hypothetical protein